MSEPSAGKVMPGAYNDARIRLTGSTIMVTQNPVMFIVIVVFLGGIGALLFFLSASGQMNISGIPIPPSVAKIIGMIIGLAFWALTLVCIFQTIHPGALVIESPSRCYTKHGGIVGKLLGKGGRKGLFDDFQKVRVAHCRNTNPSGQSAEYWRLTLFWKDGMEQNLGCYKTSDQANAQAGGFTGTLGIQTEAVEGGM